LIILLRHYPQQNQLIAPKQKIFKRIINSIIILTKISHYNSKNNYTKRMELYQGKPIYSRIITFFISILFGMMGIDRLYLKDYKLGILKFATLGGLGVWYLLDIFQICIGKKLGSGNYWWSCELDKKYDCNYETTAIIKGMIIFAVIVTIVMLFYGPTTSNKLMVKDDLYEQT